MAEPDQVHAAGGFGPTVSSTARIKHNALLFGTLVGIGVAGFVGGSVVAQFVVATVTATVLAGGLSVGLGALASRYLPQHNRPPREYQRSTSTGHTERSLEPDGGDRE